MQVDITLPRVSEADTEVDGENEVIRVRPRFRLAAGAQCIAFITIKGDKGAERRYVLKVSGNDGRLIIDPAKSVEANFDRVDKVVAKPRQVRKKTEQK